MKAEDEQKNTTTHLGRLNMGLIKKLGYNPDRKQQTIITSNKIGRDFDTSLKLQDQSFFEKMNKIDPALEALRPVNLTMSQIKEMTDEELIKTLTGEFGPKSRRIADGSMRVIHAELIARQIITSSKPHWTIIPAFILLICTIILTAIPLFKNATPVSSEVSNSESYHANKSDEIKKSSGPQ